MQYNTRTRRRGEAVKSSRCHVTTLVGEDTDLLILLLYYAETNTRSLYYRISCDTHDILEYKKIEH